MVVVGEVVRFDSVKGFGIAHPDSGGEDVFSHVNDVNFDKNILRFGTRVQFSVDKGVRGLKASRVQLTEPREVDQSRSVIEPVRSAGNSPADLMVEDDSLCDVLSAAEFASEVIEALLQAAPTVRAEQILQIRRQLVRVGQGHGWIDGSSRQRSAMVNWQTAYR